MGAAAAAPVAVLHLDHPQVLHLRLFAQRQLLQRLSVRVAHEDRPVFIEDAVDLLLNLAGRGGAQLPIQVDGVHLVPHVEADVVQPQFGEDDAGEDVLPAVNLHVGKALFKVDLPLGAFPDRKRTVAQVEDLLALLIGVQDVGGLLPAAQGADVGRLAAALGEKAGFVKLHRKAGKAVFLGLLAGEDGGGAALDIAVQVKQFFGHGALPSPITWLPAKSRFSCKPCPGCAGRWRGPSRRPRGSSFPDSLCRPSGVRTPRGWGAAPRPPPRRRPF